jgi:ribonuclease E
MSRQRIRTSVLESSTEKCPYCGGSGHVRSVSSLALQVLRAMEEQLMRGATHNLIARTRPDVALYVLNQKRAHLRSLEERFAITLTVVADATVMAPQAFVIDRGEQVHTVEAARALAEQNQQQAVAAPLEDEDDLEDESIVEEEAQAEAAEDEDVEAAAPSTVPEHGEGEPRRRRRRRGRGGRGGRDGRDGGEHREHIPIHEGSSEYPSEPASEPVADGDDEASAADEVTDHHGEPAQAERTGRSDRAEQNRDGERRGRRRRGRRGGRRNRHDRDHNGDAAPGMNDPGAPAPQHSFSPGDELAAPAAAEPELKDAVADLDAAPPFAPPAPISAEPPHAEQQAAPPRRRSTVRERAPIGGSDDAPPPPAATAPVAPTPAAEPAVSEVAATEDTNQPRKTGWWSRRFAGG